MKALKLRLLVLLGIVWGTAGTAWAQGGVVRGTLQEVGTNKPVSFASVVLLRSPDSTFVAGAQADEAGVFELGKLPLGPYILRATAVGSTRKWWT